MSGNKMLHCIACGKRHGEFYPCRRIPMIHWIGTPEGYCSRKDHGDDVIVETYQTSAGEGSITHTALAHFIGNVNCPRCREAYALAEYRKKQLRIENRKAARAWSV